MSTVVEIAIAMRSRGWKVFPCVPKSKRPLTTHGFKDASCDEAQIRSWWAANPNANIAIACGESDLTVLDVDYGLDTEEDFRRWREATGLPNTYTVRTGRRPSFGVQMYFRGGMPSVGMFDLHGCKGQVKSQGGYVMAAGSVHPDTGETYQVLVDAEAAHLPEVLRSLKRDTSQSVVPANDFKLARLLAFLEYYEIAAKAAPTSTASGWRVDIECPWSSEHTGESIRETSVFWSPIRGFGFKCLHGHCDGRNWHSLKAEMQRRFPNKPPFFGKLPTMTHADIATGFIAENDSFVAVYDLPGRPIAAFVGTRWDTSDDSQLLRRAVRDYLDELYHRYPKPEDPDKKDPRRALKSANFADSVMREVRPLLPPVHSSTFDREPFLLGLPGGSVAELRTGTVRPMRREDGITRRIAVTPLKMLTDRFDRFIQEITCGNTSMGEFLLDLMALCLTGEPVQRLIWFLGSGRNGKSVFLRLLGKLLGPFFFPLRTNDLIVNRNGDSEKRTVEKFRGMRAAAPGEAVGHSLNYALLKVLSGGDTLTGAKMRQDETPFAPTHKLILISNELPDLPADEAFRGRVLKVEFNANFRGREDRMLEPTMEAELPGILHKLLMRCPDVVRNGLKAPDCVTRATDEMFAELDITGQFADACLAKDENGFVTWDQMNKRVSDWISVGEGRVLAGDYPQRQVEKVLRELKQRNGVRFGQAPRPVRSRAYFGVSLKAQEVGS